MVKALVDVVDSLSEVLLVGVVQGSKLSIDPASSGLQEGIRTLQFSKHISGEDWLNALAEDRALENVIIQRSNGQEDGFFHSQVLHCLQISCQHLQVSLEVGRGLLGPGLSDVADGLDEGGDSRFDVEDIGLVHLHPDVLHRVLTPQLHFIVIDEQQRKGHVIQDALDVVVDQCLCFRVLQGDLQEFDGRAECLGPHEVGLLG